MFCYKRPSLAHSSISLCQSILFENKRTSSSSQPDWMAARSSYVPPLGAQNLCLKLHTKNLNWYLILIYKGLYSRFIDVKHYLRTDNTYCLSSLFLPSHLHCFFLSLHRNTGPKWPTPSFHNIHSWCHPGRAKSYACCKFWYTSILLLLKFNVLQGF